MKVKLTKEYNVITYKKVDLIIDNLEDLKDYIINNKPTSKKELEIIIEDYFHYFHCEADIDVPIGSDETFYDDLDMTINNLDDVVEHYSYMINPEEETCCSGQEGRYCSNCGKKLK